MKLCLSGTVTNTLPDLRSPCKIRPCSIVANLNSSWQPWVDRKHLDACETTRSSTCVDEHVRPQSHRLCLPGYTTLRCPGCRHALYPRPTVVSSIAQDADRYWRRRPGLLSCPTPPTESVCARCAGLATVAGTECSFHNDIDSELDIRGCR